MIRVLVVDDSALMRKKISDILNSDSQIEVIDIARTGAEAIKKVVQLKPDVVTMDIEMPDIDGLTALTYIMNEIPTPVVIISAHISSGSANALKALELGAVETISKPSGQISLDIEQMEGEIVRKVKFASRVNVRQVREVFNRISRKPGPTAESRRTNLSRVVAIGSSTGGPKAIKEVLPYFPADIPAAFLIVQHMPPSFTGSMAERINWITKIEVKEAEEGDVINPGFAYIAPGGFHMLVEKSGEQEIIRLHQGPKVNSVRPSITLMMNSAAECFGSKCIGVLLTGMGQDGVEGMRSIKRAGGVTFAEDESTCVVFGMPRVAIQEGVVDKVLPIHHMGLEIMKTIKA